MHKVNQGMWLGWLLALAILASGTAGAQEGLPGELRNFEVLLIEGNKLVVRDEKGTQEYTVPSTFIVNVDGKKVALTDVKAGMKGSATITEFTTVRPVHVTTVNMGTVVSQAGNTVTVKDADGNVHRFTQDEADERGARMYMDGKRVQANTFAPGDKLTATVVSAQPTEIETAADVDAALAGDTGDTATAAEGAAQASAAQAAADADAATESEEITDQLWIWILLLLVVAVLLVWIFSRKKSPATATKK